MKALSKPLSSPGRADKFPPPLMRFLRSNVGSRSRGRSRTSPLFYLRSRKSAVPIETTQEPSSPKVTCIGQVRVHRRAKKSNRRRSRRRRAWWRAKNPLFCGFRRLFCKCCLVFRFGYSKKVESKEDSFRVHSDKIGETRNDAVLAGNDNNSNTIFSRNTSTEIDCNNKKGSLPESTPKNALLLTRCRSAPYRSSSLAGRFWGPPLGDSEAEIEEKLDELVKTRISEESSKELRVSVMEKEEELEGSNGGGEGERSVHPMVLTRCKSEPARTGERLIPQSNFPTLNL